MMLKGNPFVFQGFEIPSDNPFFITILSIHILAAFLSVVCGIIAMFAKKQYGLHPRTGTIYFWSLMIVFITASLMAFLRWKEDGHLFFLGFASFSAAFLGRTARKNLWKKWSIYHIAGMGVSYVILLIAFYVDNGRFLPVWKSIDPIFYWLLPPLVGIPIIFRALMNSPFSKNYFTKNK